VVGERRASEASSSDQGCVGLVVVGVVRVLLSSTYISFLGKLVHDLDATDGGRSVGDDPCRSRFSRLPHYRYLYAGNVRFPFGEDLNTWEWQNLVSRQTGDRGGQWR
jgi:hypothetical protein